MLKLIADTHTHTLASTHAFSTILENARFASEIGLSYLGWTDHAPMMTDAPHIWHFQNLEVVPDQLCGVRVLKGAEADICDGNGTLDLENWLLADLEWVVASVHRDVMEFHSVEEQTSAYIAAARNPYVDVIGHSGLASHPYDYETAVKAFAQAGKLVEINQGTFRVRQKSIPNCVAIAKLCMQYECRIVVDSDAHFAYDIGQCPDVLAMLEEIGFPEELVVNADVARFESYLAERRARIQSDESGE